MENAKLIFFSNTPPDIGVSEALKLLGFECTEKSRPEAEPAPLEELRTDLTKSPAVLGPLDMGYLSYFPWSEPGVDHFVMAYAMDEDEIHLHDPAGFPHVSLPLDQLERAWKAERIGYRRDYYRYWTLPKRVHHPTEGEIYGRALQYFRSGYQYADDLAARESWTTGHEAILTCADHVRGGEVSPPEVGHMVGFAFKLGATRALDFATFFGFRDAELATLKRRQAKLFGRCHTLAVRKEWSSLADILQELAGVEEEFRVSLFAC
ncbi:MAG: hypothetical protein ACETWR_24465 [Anaerolineae bacterium]